MSFDYDVTGAREVPQTSASAGTSEVGKSQSKTPLVKAKSNTNADRVEISGEGNTNEGVSSAQKDNAAKFAQDKERVEMYQLRSEIKQKILDNIDKLVALDTGNSATRAEYHAKLKNMIKEAVQKRVESVKTDKSVTTSEQRVIDTLMQRASFYNNDEMQKKVEDKCREMYNELSDKEQAMYHGVRGDDIFDKYVGHDAPENLVRYMVKQQYGDYGSGKSDKLETLLDALIDEYTKQALQGKDESIDIKPILDYETKEMHDRLWIRKEAKKEESKNKRIPKNLGIADKATDEMDTVVGSERGKKIRKEAKKIGKNYTIEDYLQGK